MKGKFAFAVAMGAILAVGQAHAATLRPVTGSVSANLGNGFTQVTGPVSVAPGTKVMAARDSEGLIEYKGCSTRVLPGRVYVVDDKPNCNGASIDAPMGLGHRDYGGAPYAYDHAGLVIGGMIVGGGVAGALVLLRDDDDPASP